ncbi:acyltransferase family protein [Thalassotalea ganghwensis]
MYLNKHHSLLANVLRLFKPSTIDMPARRYDLDWLRITVFGLLILFHTGMFYTLNWGWHIKSDYRSQWLETVMLTIEPWRMAVLWVIAGIAIRFVMAKVSAGRFIVMRSIRLLLPLLFGVLVIVPPQLYVEMTYNGDLSMSYWQFLREFFSTDTTVFAKYNYGIWPHIDVNHLWFIRSLWQYSLVILCLLPLLNSRWGTASMQWLFRQPGIIALGLAVTPLFIIQLNWGMDEVRYPVGFTLMIYGYLIGWDPLFWQRVKSNGLILLVSLIIGYGVFAVFYNLVWLDVIHGTSNHPQWLISLGLFNYSLLRVLGALTVFALAAKYWNKPSTKLSYFNDAVYPYFILHQTLIIVFGYHLSSLQLGPVLEPLLLISLTVLGCYLSFEVIRRSNVLRPLFGLSMTGSYNLPLKRLGYVSACLLITPIGLEILL